MRSRLDLRRSCRPLLEALETRALLSVCTVDRLTDLGEGKGMAGDLRYCIGQAQDGDAIQFDVAGTISLTRALPNLTRSISMEGPGANLLTVRRDTGGDYRIFTVAPGVTGRISGLTIANGWAPNGLGGGLFNEGALTVSHSILRGNSTGSGASQGGGIYNRGTLTMSDSTLAINTAMNFGRGGAIFNTGTLTISRSTLAENSALLGSGGIDNDGGRVILSDSTLSRNSAITCGGICNRNTGILVITNSTLSGNSARDTGGAIVTVGTLTISSSTIAGNSAGIVGGGIITGDVGFRARNTILATNTANYLPDLEGRMISLGHNLIGNTDGGTGFDKTDLLNVNPQLGPLQENGGSTRTRAPLPGSPAIDAGDNFDAPEFDQRGLSRVTGNRIDIGAFEVQPGPAAFFYLYAPESAVAGVPFDLYLIAYDADGYVATTYTGTVAFFSGTDPDAVLPEPYTFAENDAGVLYLPERAVLYAEGLQELWAYDVDTFAFGLASVEVFPGSAPGGAPNSPWTYWPDAATLLALLSQQPRLRP